MARPTKLSPEIIESVAEGVASGMPFCHAAVAAGISERSFFKYQKIGKEDEEAGIDSEFAQFARAMKKAEAEAIRANLEIITMAAVDSWQAAAWILERRHPDQFGRRTRLEHALPPDAESEFTLTFRKPADED